MMRVMMPFRCEFGGGGGGNERVSEWSLMGILGVHSCLNTVMGGEVRRGRIGKVGIHLIIPFCFVLRS